MSSFTSRIGMSNLSVPPATKGLLIATTAGSLLLQFLKRKVYKELVTGGANNVDYEKIIVPYLQLIPNHTLLHPWTVVTAVFVDMYIWRFIFSIIVMFFAGKFIERSWSSKELIKFVTIVGAFSNLGTSLSLIFINLIFGTAFFNIPVDGNICVLISYIVVFKQLIPEHSIVLFKGVAQTRVKQVPLLTLIVITIVSAANQSLTPALQSWIGFLVSWIYLRFFQPNVVDPALPNPNGVVGVQKIYGDASDTFSLVHFFPDALTPILSPIFDQFYELAIQLGLLTRFDQADVEESNARAGRRAAGIPGSSAASSDARNAAERRRQVALKVLEERINDDSRAEPATSSA